MRVLIAVTHLLGAGHLTRAAALARAFARASHAVVLVSGGQPAPQISTEGVRLVQLPPLQTAGTDFTTLIDESGCSAGPERFDARRDMMLAALEAAQPHAVVTELFPFGRRALAGEFLALVERARAMRPRPLVLSSVRDILVTPEKPGRVDRAHERLLAFDAALVHGDPDLIRLNASWPVDGRIGGLLRYTGYIDDGAPVAGSPMGADGEILVSGGSSAASMPLYQTAIGAATLLPERLWRILVGRGVPDDAFADLRSAAPANAVVERARPDFRALLGGAVLSVSQAGYNTVVDLLRARTSAVLVPFEGGSETEQRLRADSLAERGLAHVLPEQDLTAASLAGRVADVLDRPPPLAHSIQLDGAERTVAIVEALAAERFLILSAAMITAARQPDWSPLDEALARASNEGRAIAFWWRDDDAVAHTPALDRLFALAARFEAPLALAAIQALVEPSLVARLSGEARAGILVHGLSHQNHAPQDQAKAEFGADRSRDKMIADAAEGLLRAQAHFGARACPVFVPPWNRIAPALVTALPALRYRGLSTYQDRAAREAAPGLVQVNTHLDPIDWRGGRSLADPDALIAGLAQRIARRIAGPTQDPEPIGLLTHHLQHDEAVWTFCEALLNRLAPHAAVRFPPIMEIFSPNPASPPSMPHSSAYS